MILDKRDHAVKSIRPELPANANSVNSIEHFQNDTLHPIIKFQDSLVFAQFEKYVRKFKPAFNAYNQRAQRNYIQEVLTTDPRIRNSLIATIVSMMTLEEYNFYCEHKIQVNVRIITMLTERLQEHLELLY